MNKSIFIILLFISSAMAEQSDYDSLYNNINISDDNDTKATIRKHIYGEYNLKPHQTNYFLPVSYRLKSDYNNNSKLPHNSTQMETEFQLSIKYELGGNLFGLNEIYSAAYTQKSFWQIYVDSAYFRETNYNPELFVRIPITIDFQDNGIKAIGLGFAHMSNGRGGAQERSWNYLYADLYFQIKPIFLDFKFWYRLKDSIDYNPQLIDYLGHGQVSFFLPYKTNMFETKLRYSSKAKFTVELAYSHPVFLRDDLFFYFKAFSGYGESLIDYNQKIQKIGIGFSISR